MNYPVWEVPIIGTGWVIGTIAIVHVLISHFAIGGGFYLPLAERKALREGRGDWMEALRRHAKFFLVLTTVFGALTGVGIWFSIGLVHPEATSALIHNFVFGWAIEWVFFLVEISAAMVYYYTWGRVPPRTHQRVGWVYAISAWASLAVINGILTFMLTPGAEWLAVAGTGAESSRFWSALFNPTYFPSLLLRTCVCISMAGIFALLTASRIDSFATPRLKAELVRWSVRWLVPSFLFMPPLFLWYLWQVPDTQRDLLQFGIATIGQGTFTQVTRTVLITIMTSATILGITYFLAWRNPLDFGFSHALAVLALAFAATGSTELAREMLRKPYVVAGYMYSNGVRKSDLEERVRTGYLAASSWVRPEELAVWRSGGPSSPEQQRVRGELLFRGQCLSCHTRDGYRAMQRFLQERDRAAIGNVTRMLRDAGSDSPYRSFMPPLVGTDEEIEALIEYLDWLAAGRRAELARDSEH